MVADVDDKAKALEDYEAATGAVLDLLAGKASNSTRSKAKALRRSKEQPEYDPNELADLIETPAVGSGVGSHLLIHNDPPEGLTTVVTFDSPTVVDDVFTTVAMDQETPVVVTRTDPVVTTDLTPVAACLEAPIDTSDLTPCGPFGTGPYRPWTETLPRPAGRGAASIRLCHGHLARGPFRSDHCSHFAVSLAPATLDQRLRRDRSHAPCAACPSGRRRALHWRAGPL